MKRTILITSALLILYGCASQLYQPASLNVQKARQVEPDITLAELQSARKLYAAKCSSCHNLHLPGEYTAIQWPKILDKMQPKARISDDQKKLILAYLTSE
ncbi:MAG: c-type cytochrome [Chitinophagaceae bacterium]